MVVLSFHIRKAEVMSLIDMRGESGEERRSNVFCKLWKYIFCSLDKGRILMLTVPVRRVLPKEAKLSGPIIFLSGDIVNGVPSG